MRTRLQRGGFLIFVLVFCCFCLTMFFNEAVQATKRASITGKIVKVEVGAWKLFAGRNAHLVIKGDKDDIYNVYTGSRTGWTPRRAPVVGDRVRCECVQDATGRYAGKWRALSVTYQ